MIHTVIQFCLHLVIAFIFTVSVQPTAYAHIESVEYSYLAAIFLASLIQGVYYIALGGYNQLIYTALFLELIATAFNWYQIKHEPLPINAAWKMEYYADSTQIFTKFSAKKDSALAVFRKDSLTIRQELAHEGSYNEYKAAISQAKASKSEKISLLDAKKHNMLSEYRLQKEANSLAKLQEKREDKANKAAAMIVINLILYLITYQVHKSKPNAPQLPTNKPSLFATIFAKKSELLIKFTKIQAEYQTLLAQNEQLSLELQKNQGSTKTSLLLRLKYKKLHQQYIESTNEVQINSNLLKISENKCKNLQESYNNLQESFIEVAQNVLFHYEGNLYGYFTLTENKIYFQTISKKGLEEYKTTNKMMPIQERFPYERKTEPKEKKPKQKLNAALPLFTPIGSTLKQQMV